MPPTYPPPPWHTHGYAAMRAYRVPRDVVTVPEGLTIRARGEHCIGVLAFVRYLAPSPLQYGELIWMPTRVEAKGKRGWYVARMHVDDESTLAAGREVWALPKTMARFEESDGHVDVRSADGSRIVLRIGGRGPALPSVGSIVTLQSRAGQPVSFKATSRARAQLGMLEVESIDVGEPEWESFLHAVPMRAPAVYLKRYETTMHPPIDL